MLVQIHKVTRKKLDLSGSLSKNCTEKTYLNLETYLSNMASNVCNLWKTLNIVLSKDNWGFGLKSCPLQRHFVDLLKNNCQLVTRDLVKLTPTQNDSTHRER